MALGNQEGLIMDGSRVYEPSIGVQATYRSREERFDQTAVCIPSKNHSSRL